MSKKRLKLSFCKTPPPEKSLYPIWNTRPSTGDYPFIQKCHELTLRSASVLKRFIIDQFHRYTGILMKKGETYGEKLYWMRIQIGYWIEKCRMEDLGIVPSKVFMNNYHAALSGKIDKFDELAKSAISYLIESLKKGENQMVAIEEAKKSTTKESKKDSKKVGKKILKLSKKDDKKVGKVTKEAPKKVGKEAPKKIAKETPKKKVAGKSSSECPFRAGTAREQVYMICKKMKSMDSAIKAVQSLENPNATTATIEFVRGRCPKHFSW